MKDVKMDYHNHLKIMTLMISIFSTALENIKRDIFLIQIFFEELLCIIAALIDKENKPLKTIAKFGPKSRDRVRFKVQLGFSSY